MVGVDEKMGGGVNGWMVTNLMSRMEFLGFLRVWGRH